MCCTALPGYAELHCLTNFSFQRGASHPGELVAACLRAGLCALAITDECSVAGVVRAYSAWKDLQAWACRTLAFQADPGQRIPLRRFPAGGPGAQRDGWGNLCEFITAARREAKKGEYIVSRDSSDFSLLAECEILIAPDRGTGSPSVAGDVEQLESLASWAHGLFGYGTWLAVELSQGWTTRCGCRRCSE